MSLGQRDQWNRLATTTHRGFVAHTWFVLLWGALVGASLLTLAGYNYRSGHIESPPLAREAGVDVSSEMHTLVLVVHPKCPCSRSTVFELERLMFQCRDRLRCIVYVFAPDGEEAGWGGDDPFGIAARIPQVEIMHDPGGRLARRLGGFTSGSVVLYNESGAPVFWGGITAGRGHAGDNLGSDSIRAIVNGFEPPRMTTPVYGCDLVTPGECPDSVPLCCEDGSDG